MADIERLLLKHFSNQDDRRLAQMYLNCLEIKNIKDNDSEEVSHVQTPTTYNKFNNASYQVIYYSPLMNVLPPFFKYVKGFLRPEIVELIYKRLFSVDEYANGFVGNMFRNILEAEIKVKGIIVDDFVFNLKPNPLDYNLATHTMKLKTDYLLLVTKLYQYQDHSKLLQKPKDDEPRTIPRSELPAYKPSNEPSCCLKVWIKSGKYVKNPCDGENPPNTYISIINPFESSRLEVKTPVVYRTRFPRWNFEHEIPNLPISHVCNILMKYELMLQVYHKKMPKGGQYATQESILIGTVYVDASSLVKRHNQLQVSGLYHIFRNQNDKDLDDFESTNQVTQGQLEVAISVDQPLLDQLENQDTEQKFNDNFMQEMQDMDKKIDDLEPEKDQNLFQKAMMRGRQLRNKSKFEEEKATGDRLRQISRSPQREGHQDNIENSDQNIGSLSIQELKVKYDQNFKDLEDITSKLKSTLMEPRDDLDESENVEDFARATDQNINADLE